MNKDFEKDLHIEGKTLGDIREDLNDTIQKTIYNMISHEAQTGKVSLSITFGIEEEWRRDRDPIKKLGIDYKVKGSATLQSEEKKDKKAYEDDELEFVNDEWILIPVTGRPQRTLLDKEVE